MNDLPLKKLTALTEHFGKDLLNDYARCDELLTDFCGDYSLEISLLVAALRAGCAKELKESAKDSFVANRVAISLAKRLHDTAGITDEYSTWAITSLVIVLELQIGEPLNDNLAQNTATDIYAREVKCPHCNITDTHRYVRATGTTIDFRCKCCNKPFFILDKSPRK